MRSVQNIKRVCAAIFWLLIWQLAAMLVDQSLILVSPVQVIARLGELLCESSFILSVATSASRIVTGFLAGLIFGTLLAILAARFELIEAMLSPLLSAIKAVPVASFTILALFLIPAKSLSVLVTFLIALPLVYANMLTGIKSTDRALLEMAQLFRMSNVKRTTCVYFSQVLPYFRSASDVAAGLSWKSGVAAELIVIAANSIGERLYEAKVGLETAELFAWTIVVIALSFLTELIFRKLTDMIWYLIQRI